MSLYAIAGSVGAGKSFCAVNSLMADVIRNTRRHVYTNLPCDQDELEWYLSWLAKSPSLREEYRKRLHFLYPGKEEAWEEYWAEPFWLNERKEVVPRDCWPRNAERAKGRGWEFGEKELPWPVDLDQEAEYRRAGHVKRKRSLGLHDRVAEFWFFTEPNAVIFLDETADIFNALKSKDRPETLQSYINHHRHYKDDLYFFMQAVDDIDVQVRRKILYLYYVENMKTVPMFNHWTLRGLRWPIQHFRVRQYLARKVLRGGQDYDRFEPLNGWKVWPSRRKYKNYRSFSAAQSLKGKKLPPQGAASTDMDTPWMRVREWVFNLGQPLAVLGAIGVGIYMGIRFLYALAGLDSTSVGQMMGLDKATTNGAVNVTATTTNQSVVVQTNVVAVPAVPDPPKPVERVILVTSVGVHTTERYIGPGSVVGSNVVAGVVRDGLRWVNGGGASWDVLFPGGRVPRLGRGRSDQRMVQGGGPGQSGESRNSGVGAVGVSGSAGSAGGFVFSGGSPLSQAK